MPYQRHDENNNPVDPGLLLDINAYERYTEENTLDIQPTFETVTYEGNSWKNWNLNYIRHGINGEDLDPDVPITILTESSIDSTATVGQPVTGNVATFSGGTGGLTIEGRFFIDKGGSHSDLSNWSYATEYDPAPVQTYTPTADDIGKELIFVTRAVDINGITAISISPTLVTVQSS